MDFAKWLCLSMAFFILAGCAGQALDRNLDALYGPATPKPRWLSGEQYTARLAEGKVSFVRDVKPILDSRCVVCHGCYDAPCQLKLESPEGLDRGASKAVVYATRLEPMAPTRLFVDGKTTADWRGKQFFPVLNEREDSSTANLDGSTLYQMLLLKQDHAFPTSGKLPASFKFELDRELQCPAREEFGKFQRQHPDWGMPYGFPPLRQQEFETVSAWLEQGGEFSPPPPVSAPARKEVQRWEAFLNGDSPKEQLVARYLYEHWFAGHLHIKGHTQREFFRLVRSKTPPGQPIDEIPSLRPYEDPGVDRPYYRLRPLHETLVDKNHQVYELGPERLRRLKRLFFEPSYAVTRLPSYQPDIAANPIKAFAEIPPRARYQFLLDDAYFFITGFMKGPVCRGQVALNVIRDRFWVAFFDPDADPISNDADFLAQQGERLRLPSERSNDIDPLWNSYADLQQDYLKAKHDYLNQGAGKLRNSLNAVWDGGGRNPDALLTAFRHFDSASLSRGFVGDAPLTGWLLDYPLLERIHYLLVAGFNVFGNVNHQFATRRFMDLMRMEAENNFLSLLPARERKAVHDSWNRGTLGQLHAARYNPYYGYGPDSQIAFKTRDHRQELFGLIQAKVEQAAPAPDGFNACPVGDCGRAAPSALEQRAARDLQPLSDLQGGGIRYLPELSFIRVHDERDGPDGGAVFSLVKNKMLSNVSLLFLEEERRLPEEDNLTVVPGFVGSFPNFFFDLNSRDVTGFAQAVLDVRSPADVEALAARYGIRRSHPDFWKYSDFFNHRYRARHPVSAGWFDLNRYDNL
jgi:hypothetical protein